MRRIKGARTVEGCLGTPGTTRASAGGSVRIPHELCNDFGKFVFAAFGFEFINGPAEAHPAVDEEQDGAMALRQLKPARRQFGLTGGGELRRVGGSLGQGHGRGLCRIPAAPAALRANHDTKAAAVRRTINGGIMAN